MRPRRSGWVWALLLLPVGLSFIALMLGRYSIAPGEVFGSLFGAAGVPDTIRALILRVRLPRILAAACIGANLAVSGAAFQGLFRNPLVAPRILGVSSGAAFGAALAFLISNNSLLVQPLAFAFGILAIFLVWMVGRQFGASLLVLVVTG
ncbi:MAG: iron chelate uptake ABC transporter family permease subunit, partial [Candidatus Bipolaricaulota bacterium]|nr:iron chelate uptake ABC transporter family permease subunit [Candidatus Bipolaricaulota bacterium]